MIYAHNTTVSAIRTRNEIEETLERYGADGFAYATQGNMATVIFAMENRRIRFVLELPDPKDFRYTNHSSISVLFGRQWRGKFKRLVISFFEGIMQSNSSGREVADVAGDHRQTALQGNGGYLQVRTGVTQFRVQEAPPLGCRIIEREDTVMERGHHRLQPILQELSKCRLRPALPGRSVHDFAYRDHADVQTFRWLIPQPTGNRNMSLGSSQRRNDHRIQEIHSEIDGPGSVVSGAAG